MQIDGSARGNWSTRTGFILAAAGSAIGLGNIWRFPFTAGQNGGGAFVLLYFVFVLAIGIPVQLSELSIGRSTQRNSVGAFKRLAPGTNWHWVGGLGVLCGFGILSFYSVIAGWTLGYIYHAFSGQFGVGFTSEESGALFGSLVTSYTMPILLCAVFMALTVAVVRKGISGGIERAAKVLMPVFFLLLIALAIRSLTLPGASAGLSFLFEVDFSKLTPEVMGNALGQALFSLSLGMGAMITYGSYLSKDENLPMAAGSVALFDTTIALLAGLILFPALFSAGVEPQVGPSLVFVVMPTIFGSMPFGAIFGIAFYVLLAIAALTSTISLLEVIVAYLVDERSWSRNKAATVVGIGCFLLAVPSALSTGANVSLTQLYQQGGADKGFLDLMDMLWGKYGLTFGALGICLFAGWRWGVANALEEIEGGGHKLPGAAAWKFLVRYVCPVALLVILFLVITGRADF